MPSTLTFALAGALAVLANCPYAGAVACPPLGPVLVPPRAPSRSDFVKTATASLATALQSEFNSQMKASAISIGVKSVHEDQLLFNYHFTPPTQSGIGTKVIDENTIYRVEASQSFSQLWPCYRTAK